MYLISPTSAWILHSTPYFFILVFPTAFYDRSRMTGRYLVPFCKKRFSFCSHYFHFLRFCSHLPLSSANAATLAKAKRLTHFYSVASLLEKWFACFPTSGDSSRLIFFQFFSHICPFRRVTFPILSLFPVMQRRLFYLIRFFIFVCHP